MSQSFVNLIFFWVGFQGIWRLKFPRGLPLGRALAGGCSPVYPALFLVQSAPLPSLGGITPGWAVLRKGDLTYSRWSPKADQNQQTKRQVPGQPRAFSDNQPVLLVAWAAEETAVRLRAFVLRSLITEPLRNPPSICTALYIFTLRMTLCGFLLLYLFGLMWKPSLRGLTSPRW